MPHERRKAPLDRAPLASDRKITNKPRVAAESEGGADWFRTHVLAGNARQLAFVAEDLTENTSTNCRRCGRVSPSPTCGGCESLDALADGVCTFCGTRRALPDSALCAGCDQAVAE